MGGANLARTSGKANSERLFASNTAEFVEQLANEAVKHQGAKSDQAGLARLESIKNVDRILGNLDEHYAKDPPTISVQGLGAYMGEGIRSEPVP